MTPLILSLALAARLTAVQEDDPPGGARVLVEQEAAFCDACAEHGIRGGFLQFLAADSILFRPHAVPGREWMQQSPAAPGDLTWYPVTGRLAASGELGFSTGPFVMRGPGGQVGHGQYVSVWRRAEDGWRVLLDTGARHAAPSQEVPRWTPAPAEGPSSPAPAADVEEDLREADEDLSTLLAEDGPAAVFELYGHPDLRYLQDGVEPVLGRDAAIELPADPRPLVFTRQGLGHSVAGDLAYTYGKVEVEDGDAAGNTLRIWTRDTDGEWRVLLFLIDLPPA